MALAVSSYDVGSHSIIDPYCLGTCQQSKAQVENLTWRYLTSENPIPDDGDQNDGDQDKGEWIETDEPS